MKYYIFLFFLVAAITAAKDVLEATKEAFKKISKECRSESKVADNELKKLEIGDWSSEDVAVKDYFRCLMKRTLFDSNGMFRKELITTRNTDKVSDTLRKCEEQVGEVALDTSWDFAKCYMPDIPEHLIIEP